MDPEYQRRMYIEGLGFDGCELDPPRESGAIFERRMRVVPRLELPGPIRKLLGERFAYFEHIRYDRETKHWDWHLEMPVLGQRLTIAGDIEMEPKGELTCTRKANFRIEARIFGVGGLLEKTAKKEVLANFEKSVPMFGKFGESGPVPPL